MFPIVFLDFYEVELHFLVDFEEPPLITTSGKASTLGDTEEYLAGSQLAMAQDVPHAIALVCWRCEIPPAVDARPFV